MGFVYRKLLQDNRLARARFPARAWAAAKRAAGLYLRRRRQCMARHARRVTWSGLLVSTMRRAVVGLSKASPPPPPPPASYDSDSYARNFDDGEWKMEEEEFWRSGSFAYRFGNYSTSTFLHGDNHNGSLIDAAAN